MRTKTVIADGLHRGFKKGVGNVPMARYKSFIDQMMESLGWSKFQVHHYICGRTICKPEQVEAVEAVFKSFGITKNIWDE